MKEPINVGLGERVVSRNPEDVLVAYGLGSCVAVSLYDSVEHLCGLLHAVLPQRMNGSDEYCPKYVDSGIEGLLVEMEKQGADRKRMLVRIAGGANMLTVPGITRTFDIGTRNIESAQNTLQRLNLPVRKAEVGGNIGRTVRLYCSDGRMTVRVVGGKDFEI